MIRGRAAAGALATALCALACGGPPRPVRTPFVALWIEPERALASAGELDRLAAAGAGELFLGAANLVWEGARPRIDAAPLPACARPRPTTLVVSGIWAEPEESPRATARAWRDALAPLWPELAARACTPAGVHFELASSNARAPLARTLARLRDELPPGVLVSVAVDAGTLALDGTRELAASVDYLVATVWGQPPGEPEDAARWDLEQGVWPRIAMLESLGRRYALGAWTLGTAWRRAAGGAVAAEDPSVALEAALAAPGAEFRAEALLEGIGRQVSEWSFAVPAIVGPWTLAPGETVRFVRPATANLEQFLERSASWGSSLRAGTILRRLPGPDEPLALSVANLAAALEPGSAEPAIEIVAESLGGSGRRWRVRVGVVNRSDEPTDFGGLESNFVELRFANAIVGRVDPGEFDSWVPLYLGREQRTVRALREADTLRLHAVRLGGGGRLESGPIEVWTDGQPPRASARASFFVPGGRVLELPERPLALGGAG
jgi:hypothetical protein